MKKFIVALLLAMSVVAPGFAASWYQFYGDEYYNGPVNSDQY